MEEHPRAASVGRFPGIPGAAAPEAEQGVLRVWAEPRARTHASGRVFVHMVVHGRVCVAKWACVTVTITRTLTNIQQVAPDPVGNSEPE